MSNMSRQKTVKEMREKSLMDMVARRWSDPTEEQTDEARKLMNSFYRLVGLSTRNFEADNDARTANKFWHRQNEVREEKWFERLKKAFEPYNITLEYSGYYPDLFEKNGSGLKNLYFSHFYD